MTSLYKLGYDHGGGGRIKSSFKESFQQLLIALNKIIEKIGKSESMHF